MARKESAKRKIQKKLTLNKETIRDLTSTKGTADAVRGGMPPTAACGRNTRCSAQESGCN